MMAKQKCFVKPIGICCLPSYRVASRTSVLNSNARLLIVASMNVAYLKLATVARDCIYFVPDYSHFVVRNFLSSCSLVVFV